MESFVATSPEELKAWDAFVATHPDAMHCHLSWWLAAHQRSFAETAIVICRDDGIVVGGAVVHVFRLPFVRQRVMIVGGGPLIAGVAGDVWGVSETAAADSNIQKQRERDILEAVLAAIEEVGRQRGALLIQYEAFCNALTQPLRDHYAAHRVSDGPIWKLYSPVLWREFRVRLAGRTPQEILADFNQGTRRKIRKAQKSELRIDAVERNEATMRDVHDVWVEDAQRQSYTPRPFDQVWRLYEESLRRGVGEVLIAWAGDEIAGFNFILHFGVGTYYLHGGYRGKHAELCPNHVLQFEAMCRSLARGAAYYSLAAPGRDGLLQYKQGFGGDLVDHTRFVAVPLRPMRLLALRPLIGDVRLVRIAKQWAARRWSAPTDDRREAAEAAAP